MDGHLTERFASGRLDSGGPRGSREPRWEAAAVQVRGVWLDQAVGGKDEKNGPRDDTCQKVN